MFTGPLEDRLIIRERYGAYCDAVFQGDVDAWLANWSHDGVWDIFGKQHRGKTELRSQWDATWGALNNMAFFAEIGSLEVSGSRASARSYCREIVVLTSGQIIKVVGCYEDELVKLNDEWLFALRKYSVLINEATQQTQ